MKTKALTFLTIAALIASHSIQADVGSNDSDDDDILAPQVVPETQIVPSNTDAVQADEQLVPAHVPAAEEAPVKGGNPSSGAEPVTTSPQEVPREEGTTPVIEKEVGEPSPEVLSQRKNQNWGSIILAGTAVVIAVVALILVGKNHGRNAH